MQNSKNQDNSNNNSSTEEGCNEDGYGVLEEANCDFDEMVPEFIIKTGFLETIESTEEDEELDRLNEDKE